MAKKLINIAAWNVNGLRARLRKGDMDKFLFGEDAEGNEHNVDILCLQETKTQQYLEEKQTQLSMKIKLKFPYRYWQSTHGTTQRKGFSGTAIWSSIKPLNVIPPPELDEQGRITALEFPDFNLVSVYTPNSGSQATYRGMEWHKLFSSFLQMLRQTKKTYVCGDLNVCHLDIDIQYPERHRNRTAGFLNFERAHFQQYLDMGYIDVFRSFYPNKTESYTWWSPFRKSIRAENKGWRLDYFLESKSTTTDIKDVDDDKKRTKLTTLKCEHLTKVMGSDHCPIKITLTV